MAEPNGTRLERLQAGQDRLLRYAHYRLGEELMKSQLGASNLPTGPSSPGTWDVEYTEDHAEELGLEPNSYDTFARPEQENRNNSMTFSSELQQPEEQPDEFSSTISASSSKVRFNESSILSTDNNIAPSPLHVQHLQQQQQQQQQHLQQQQQQQQQPHLMESQSDSVVFAQTSFSSSQINGVEASFSSAALATQIGDGHSTLSQTASAAGSQNHHSHGHATDSDLLLLKADSAMQFFMKRSQVIDPPVQVLLNQVSNSERIKYNHTLSNTLRPPPSHSYGTKKGYQKAVQRKKRQRQSKIMKSRTLLKEQLKASGGLKKSYSSAPGVFRSTSR